MYSQLSIINCKSNLLAQFVVVFKLKGIEYIDIYRFSPKNPLFLLCANVKLLIIVHAYCWAIDVIEVFVAILAAGTLCFKR